MEAALGLATNLVAALMAAAAGRLREMALGDEQERAVEAAFTGATAVMLVEVARHARLTANSRDDSRRSSGSSLKISGWLRHGEAWGLRP